MKIWKNKIGYSKKKKCRKTIRRMLKKEIQKRIRRWVGEKGKKITTPKEYRNN